MCISATRKVKKKQNISKDKPRYADIQTNSLFFFYNQVSSSSSSWSLKLIKIHNSSASIKGTNQKKKKTNEWLVYEEQDWCVYQIVVANEMKKNRK